VPLVFHRAFRCGAAFAFAALATALGQEIEVTAVRFNSVRTASGAGANGPWFETGVVLNIRPPAGSPGRMLSRVRVALLLGFELPAPAGGERRIENYRAEAECVALDAGRAEVRFYLPPEIVKRGDAEKFPVARGDGGRGERRRAAAAIFDAVRARISACDAVVCAQGAEGMKTRSARRKR